MLKPFYLDTTPFYKNKYVIRVNPEVMNFPNGMTGSFNVFIARVAGLAYPDFLRYCRDKLDAEIIGKNGYYLAMYFPDSIKVKNFVLLLNNRIEDIKKQITK